MVPKILPDRGNYKNDTIYIIYRKSCMEIIYIHIQNQLIPRYTPNIPKIYRDKIPLVRGWLPGRELEVAAPWRKLWRQWDFVESLKIAYMEAMA